MRVSALDWGSGNWPKCGKHGISREEIEEMLANAPLVFDDPYPHEPRMRAMGRAGSGRYVFIVYTERYSDGELKIRPISARYMHSKEIQYYETIP